MPPREPGGQVVRREAVRRLAAGAAGFVALSSRGTGQEVRRMDGASKRAVRVEQQETGSEVWQVTTERFQQSNIYCEVPYCSRDSRFLVYHRVNPGLARDRHELMVVELGTWKQHRLDSTFRGIVGCAITAEGAFYYLKPAAGDAVDLMRVELGEGAPARVGQLADGSRLISLGTVSSDGRYYACGKRLGDGWDLWGVLLYDTRKGAEAVIDRDPYILNPHPQVEPGEGRRLMIQHNRGGACSRDGKLLRLVGPEGATLYLLSVPDGRRTTLQVGKSHTTPCTGHEAWVGSTGEMLLTVSWSGDYAPQKGNLLGVRAGQPPRVVARGYRFNHVGVSRCGRFFCCDDWQGPSKIVVGSTQTGKTAVVCEARTSMGRPQNTHAHAYLTPDLKWVIFNSDRGGFPHIHAASVPEGMLDTLSR